MPLMNKVRFAATLALFAGLAFFAWKSGRKVYEDGPRLEIARTEDAVVLRWTHRIEAPMAMRFAEAFDRWKNETDRFVIDLNSPGGSLAEGRLVIEEIEKIKMTRRVDARVGPRAQCLSMCVPVYLRGQARMAADDAVFMFHQPSTYDLVTDEKVNRPAFERQMTSDRFFERYFVNSEMNPEWREKLSAAWKDRDLWFTARDLVEQESGVVETLE